MLTHEPTKEMLQEWKSVWEKYKDKLKPNRKSGTELLNYLQQKYVLTEIHEKEAADVVFYNVTMNKPNAEKLPIGASPIPKTFFLENAENGAAFYTNENKDPVDIWGGDITKIFVGVDIITGFYIVEGSTMLWDELYAFRGLDETDLQNVYCVAEYISCLKKFDNNF